MKNFDVFRYFSWYPLQTSHNKTNGSVELSVQYFTLETGFLPVKGDATTMHPSTKQPNGDHTSTKSASSNATSPNRSSTLVMSENVTEITEEPTTAPSIKGDEETSPPNLIDFEKFNSGVIRVTIHEASNVTSTKSKTYALATLNGNFRSPILTTLVTKNYSFPKWNETGEGFVKEINVDHLSVEIKASKEGEDKVLGTMSCKVKDILERLNVASTVNAFGKDSSKDVQEEDGSMWYKLEGSSGKVRVSFTFLPATYIIDESESARNMGILQVKVLKANDLMAADKDGSSDPYVSLSLNGNKKQQKTKTKKNNLNPTYDELFNFEITNRIGSIIRGEVFDWNQIQSHTSLGHFDLELKDIQVEVRGEVTFDLQESKKGSVTLELFFAPYYVLRDVNPSLISAALSGNPVDLVSGLAKGGFKVATGTLHLGKGVLGGAAHLGIGTGKVALTGAKHVLSAPLKIGSAGKSFAKGILNHFKDHSNDENEKNDKSPPTLSVTEADSHEDNLGSLSKFKSLVNSSSHSLSSNISGSHGNSSASRSNSRQEFSSENSFSIKLTFIEAKDLVAADRNGYSDPYVKLLSSSSKKLLFKTKVQKKTRNPYWDESFLLKDLNPNEDKEFSLVIKDYNFLKENIELGTYSLNPWYHFPNPLEGEFDTSVDIWTAPGELKNGGVGQLHFRLDLILPPGYNSQNISPKSTNVQESYDALSNSNNGEVTDEEDEERTKRGLKRSSMASLKPKNLLGSIKAKITKG